MKGLPKDALIEKQVLYHTGRRYSDIDEEDEGGDTALSSPPIYSTGTYESAPVCSLQQKKRFFLSDSHTGAESFIEGDTEVRSEVSYLQCATASAAVICGRGTSNWETISQRLEAVTHIEGRLTRALSVRLFYKAATIAGESRGTFEVDPID